MFGGADGPGPSFADVVSKEALFIPQGGADSGAEEVRARDKWPLLEMTPLS